MEYFILSGAVAVVSSFSMTLIARLIVVNENKGVIFIYIHIK